MSTMWTCILSNIKSHLSRKKLCENLLCCQKSNQDLLKELGKDRNSYDFECEFCHKKFEKKPYLNQHYKHCKDKRNIEKDNEIQRLKQVISDMKTACANNINITINQNITQTLTQNIVVNNFGSEDLSHVVHDKQFLDNCLKSIRQGLPSVIEKIYYDKNKPENHNVLMKSSKKKTALVFKDGEWKQEHLNQVVPTMVHKGTNVLSTHLHKQQIDPDDDMHGVYRIKESYLNDIMIRKKPEIFEISSAVTAIIGNHRK